MGIRGISILGYNKAFMKRKILILLLIVFCSGEMSGQKINSSGPLDSIEKTDTIDKMFIGPDRAMVNLNKLLKDTASPYLVKNRILIKDKKSLISVAEPILFDIYGKQTILKERPYEIYLFGDYWIMMGTMPKSTIRKDSLGRTLITICNGGTFNIVINRKNCEVKVISHDE